ncbi:hypothetical protein CHS0354_040912 [Potamilus streckersoni]|uniref:Uncharacterized protein n=1 Tax=Potamilus streckersoni TaxID=2493646 RepID=A0AAE0VYQ7_9BIVA|nr:hypothetical protein CHS0354_040912 [Potamilus streckersoni]
MEMISDAVFQKVMDTNVFGTVRLTRSLLPLIRQAKGRIINVTSLLGRISMEGNGAYGMSKHALVAYSDTLRQEMKKWGVFVSMIEPTGFHTASMHEQSLINKREEIWNSLDASTQESYGRDYLDKIYDTIISTSNRYPDDLTPVVRAMRSGLLSKRPRERYPCGVGAETLTILYSILPTWLSDKISLSLGIFPRDIQPAALHH